MTYIDVLDIFNIPVAALQRGMEDNIICWSIAGIIDLILYSVVSSPREVKPIRIICDRHSHIRRTNNRVYYIHATRRGNTENTEKRQ